MVISKKPSSVYLSASCYHDCRRQKKISSSFSSSGMRFVAVQIVKYNKFALPSRPIDGWRALKLPSNKRLKRTLRLN